MSAISGLPSIVLDAVRAEVKAASWFAALGEPLIDGDRSDARAYATGLDLGPLTIDRARDWPDAERILKAPDAAPLWWEREESVRKRLLADAGLRYPERALWTSLTELTTETGDFIHGKAAMAAARAGNAARQPRSMSRPARHRRRSISSPSHGWPARKPRPSKASSVCSRPAAGRLASWALG
jgi:hypothetical protein